MALTLTDRPLARAAAPVDGHLACWRCEAAVDVDGYCSLCGAVTVPRPELEPGDGRSTGAFAPFGAAKRVRLPLFPTLELHDDLLWAVPISPLTDDDFYALACEGDLAGGCEVPGTA